MTVDSSPSDRLVISALVNLKYQASPMLPTLPVVDLQVALDRNQTFFYPAWSKGNPLVYSLGQPCKSPQDSTTYIKSSTKLIRTPSVVSFLLLIPSSMCSWLPIQPGGSPTGAWNQPSYRQGLLEHLTHQPRQLQCPAGGAGHLLWSQCEHVSTTLVS